MLFWKDKSELQKYDVCDASHWKPNKKNVPEKALHHFPLRLRLQRIFWSIKNITFMRWHKEQRINDNVLRHPTNIEV